MDKGNCVYCGKPVYNTYYYKDWAENKVCVEHYDLIGRCSGCFRFVVGEGKIVEQNRCVCNSCLENEVNDVNIKVHIDYVYDLLYERGFIDIQRDHITIELVSKKKMDELFHEGEALGLHSGYSDVWNEKGRKDFKQNIYVLNHLHFINFEAILAHELIHGWQLQQNIEDLNGYGSDDKKKARAEGFAQLGCYIVYSERYKEAKAKCALANSDKEKNDATLRRNLCVYQMRSRKNDPSPYYGEAFRKILKRVKQKGLGWEQIIREARLDQLKNYV